MALVASEFITVTFPFKVNFRLHQMFNSNLIFANFFVCPSYI